MAVYAFSYRHSLLPTGAQIRASVNDRALGVAAHRVGSFDHLRAGILDLAVIAIAAVLIFHSFHLLLRSFLHLTATTPSVIPNLIKNSARSPIGAGAVFYT